MDDSKQAYLPPLVVHVIYSLGTGGLENGLVNIINRCPVDRYRHAIVCLTTAGSFAERISVPGVEIIELHKRPGHDFGVFFKLWRQLRLLRPDIVHTRNLAALETQILGLLFKRCKRVHGEHGRDVHDLDGSNWKYRWLRRLLNPLLHRFIAVSDDLASWLIDDVCIPPKKVLRIYNGVDATRFSRDESKRDDAFERSSAHHLKGVPERFFPEDGGVVVGTVGRLVEVKNQGSIIRALAHILRESPKRRDYLRCILVGNGPEYPKLAAEIARSELDDIVWLAGDRNDVPQILLQMDVFLLPSLGEGISNTVLEAMAVGLPVIATQVGGNPELVKQDETGLLVPVADVPALAAAMVAMIDSPEERERMGRCAVKRVTSEFKWENTVSSYLQVYDELLELTTPLHRIEGA
ncbi:MAG: TIGR03088 family PEP-CTERM/XrtA system glycosyltransferase [Pseudomonadota bacterium]